MPQAEFARAWANSLAGRETNAFRYFTNFLARFPASQLAPRAQYWVADHYYRQEDFLPAELNYQKISTKGSESPLATAAWMMAGRAAAATEGAITNDAIRIYTNLMDNPDVPPNLRLRAAFAAGDATMLLPPDTNNLKGNFQDAITLFSRILDYTNDPISILAQGRIADCYSQLAGLDTDPLRYYQFAVTNYARVTQSSLADATARSGAEVGWALCLEKMSLLKPPAEQAALVEGSLGHYKNVIYADNLHEGEKQDIFWVSQAGLNACRLLDASAQWEQLQGLCNKLIELAPSLQATWEKKLLKAKQNLPAGGANIE